MLSLLPWGLFRISSRRLAPTVSLSGNRKLSLEGIEGEDPFSGKCLAPYTEDKTKGERVVHVTGTYTLPSK